MKFVLMFAIVASLAAASESTPRVQTWSGLSFGMTKEEVKIALKGHNVTITDEKNDSLALSGDMGPAEGGAYLDFSADDHKLRLIKLTFNYGLPPEDRPATDRGSAEEQYGACQAEISRVGEDESIRRVAKVAIITRKYLERYGRPFVTQQGRIPGDSADTVSNSGWDLDIIHNEMWAYGVNWLWREHGQQVKFGGYLICRGAGITVEYSLEDPGF
ncbi:MAG TPA: hypothetical protein VIX19_11705 [Terriglobales bacterium]